MDEITASMNSAWLAQFIDRSFTKHQRRNAHNHQPVVSTKLHAAAKAGDLFRVRGCLGAGADLTTRDARGKTVLEVAREANCLAVVNYIEWGHTALLHALTVCLGRVPTRKEIYTAATHKRMRRFRYVVQKSTDDEFKRLITAARDGDLAAVRSMIENGKIGINVVDEATEETALSVALASGQQAVWIYLMQRGAGFHGVCWIKGERRTTLVALVLTGDVDLVRRAVSHDASVLMSPGRDASTTCALVEAAKLELFEIMELLLDYGVSFDLKRNGLDLPPLVEERLNAILLSPEGAPNEAESWLLLCAACWLESEPLFEYLLETRSELHDLSASPQNAAVALFFAVFKGNEAFVVELLTRGAPINVNLGQNVNVMVAAVMTNSTKMLQLLIDHEGDVLVASDDGDIPMGLNEDSLLTSAVYTGAMHCARMLLPLETRPEHRHGALVQAATRGEANFASLVLEALPPSTEEDALIESIECTSCPLTLDVLLTRYCWSEHPISVLHDAFRRACEQRKSTDLLAVFLAHGVDITHANEEHITSPLMQSVLGSWNAEPSEATLRFVVENGIPIVTYNCVGQTPEQKLTARYLEHSSRNDSKSALFAACRDLLRGHSQPSNQCMPTN